MMIVMTVGCLVMLHYVLVSKNLIFDQQLMDECFRTFINSAAAAAFSGGH